MISTFVPALFAEATSKPIHQGLGAGKRPFEKLAAGRKARSHPACGLNSGLGGFTKPQKRQSPE
jgi:hypothetical protein